MDISTVSLHIFVTLVLLESRLFSLLVTEENIADKSDYEAGRLLRDSRLYTVGAGTQEIRRMLIGRGFNEQFAKAEGKAIAQ
jgi:hypothetical protein